MKKKTQQIYTIVVMAVLIFGLSLFAVLKPAGDFSESERRPLEQLPELSIKTLLNGDFMDSFENYTNDQFPMRDTFRAVKALTKYYLFGLSDNNELYFADGHVAKLDFPINQESLDHASDRFTELYETYMKDKVNKVVFTVVPDKGFYLGNENGYPVMDYDYMFGFFEYKLPFAEYIDIYMQLDEDDYYLTDTHWQQQNLTEVAEKILIHLGARPFEDLEEKVATENFHGVYYGQSALPLKPEKIVYLTNPELEHMTVFNYETGLKGGIYDFEKLNGKDPYEFYLSGAVPLLEVTNSSAEGDRHLIIFRDSFGSSLAPLLMRDYSKITIIDTRYLLPNFIGNYVDFEGADVLMMYSTLILNDSFIIKK